MGDHCYLYQILTLSLVFVYELLLTGYGPETPSRLILAVSSFVPALLLALVSAPFFLRILYNDRMSLPQSLCAHVGGDLSSGVSHADRTSAVHPTFVGARDWAASGAPPSWVAFDANKPAVLFGPRSCAVVPLPHVLAPTARVSSLAAPAVAPANLSVFQSVAASLADLPAQASSMSVPLPPSVVRAEQQPCAMDVSAGFVLSEFLLSLSSFPKVVDFSDFPFFLSNLGHALEAQGIHGLVLGLQLTLPCGASLVSSLGREFAFQPDAVIRKEFLRRSPTPVSFLVERKILLAVQKVLPAVLLACCTDLQSWGIVPLLSEIQACHGQVCPRAYYTELRSWEDMRLSPGQTVADLSRALARGRQVLVHMQSGTVRPGCLVQVQSLGRQLVEAVSESDDFKNICQLWQFAEPAFLYEHSVVLRQLMKHELRLKADRSFCARTAAISSVSTFGAYLHLPARIRRRSRGFRARGANSVPSVPAVALPVTPSVFPPTAVAFAPILNGFVGGVARQSFAPQYAMPPLSPQEWHQFQRFEQFQKSQQQQWQFAPSSPAFVAHSQPMQPTAAGSSGFMAPLYPSPSQHGSVMGYSAAAPDSHGTMHGPPGAFLAGVPRAFVGCVPVAGSFLRPGLPPVIVPPTRDPAFNLVAPSMAEGLFAKPVVFVGAESAFAGATLAPPAVSSVGAALLEHVGCSVGANLTRPAVSFLGAASAVSLACCPVIMGAASAALAPGFPVTVQADVDVSVARSPASVGAAVLVPVFRSPASAEAADPVCSPHFSVGALCAAPVVAADFLSDSRCAASESEWESASGIQLSRKSSSSARGINDESVPKFPVVCSPASVGAASVVHVACSSVLVGAAAVVPPVRSSIPVGAGCVVPVPLASNPASSCSPLSSVCGSRLCSSCGHSCGRSLVPSVGC